MTVVYRGASTPNSTNSAATITLAQDIPSLANGDYMLMALYCNSTVNGPPQPPVGWTLLESTDGASFFVEVWGKIAASEPGSYIIDRNGVSAKIYAGIILAFRSSAALTLYVDDSNTQVNASSTNRTCPGVTTTKTSAGLACFFATGSNVTSTPPGDMTERLDTLFNSGLRAYAMTSILSASGATGDKVATGTAATSRAVTVAIAELAATAPTGAPQDLTATPVSASRVDLTWTHDGINTAGYSVERSTSELSGFAEVATTANKFYSDTGLSGNTTYYYRVRAYNT